MTITVHLVLYSGAQKRGFLKLYRQRGMVCTGREVIFCSDAGGQVAQWAVSARRGGKPVCIVREKSCCSRVLTE